MAEVMEQLKTEIHHALNIEVLTEASSLPSLSTDWDALVRESTATIFQTFDWQYLWWKHFGSKPHLELAIILIREEGRLIGIAPFFLQTSSMMGFKIFRQLKLLGSGLRSERSAVLSLEREGPGDYLDVIAEQGHEDSVADAVANFIIDNHHLWDEIEFQNLPENSILLSHVLPKIPLHHFDIVREVSDVCPRVILPKSLDEYLASLGIKVRRNLRHSYRAYFENPEYSLEEIGPGGNAEQGMEILCSLHQKRWNMGGYPGLFSDQRFDSLHRDLVRTMIADGRIWFKILRHNGRPIAARFGFKFNGQVCDYLSGVDLSRSEGSANYSGAGMALILEVIRQAIDSHYQIFDLARGDERYKFDFTSVVPRNYLVRIRHKSNKSRLQNGPYKLHSVSQALISRFMSESAIFGIMKRDDGLLKAIPRYVAHVKKRLLRSSQQPVENSNRDTSDEGGPVAIPSQGSGGNRNGVRQHGSKGAKHNG